MKSNEWQFSYKDCLFCDSSINIIDLIVVIDLKSRLNRDQRVSFGVLVSPKPFLDDESLKFEFRLILNKFQSFVAIYRRILSF